MGDRRPGITRAAAGDAEALFGRSSASRSKVRRPAPQDRSIIGMGGDDLCLLTIASSVAKDLALLERRAQAEGFQVWEDG
jgi:hypothetical protein